MKGCSAFKTIPGSPSNAILFFLFMMSQIICMFDRLPYISHCKGKLVGSPWKGKGALCPKPGYSCMSSLGAGYSQIYKDRSPTARSGRWNVRMLPWVPGGDAVARKESKPRSPLSLRMLWVHFLNSPLRQEGKKPPCLQAGTGQSTCPWKSWHRGRNNATSTHKLSLKL